MTADDETTEDDREDDRATVRALFGDPEPTEPADPTEEKPSNFVAGEGKNSPVLPDDPARQLARLLFDN